VAIPLQIVTPRCRLDPFRSDHLTERYVGWLNDPEVVCYSEQRHFKHSLKSCREYAQSFDAGANYLWAIIRTDVADIHIGNINAYVDVANRTADIGVLIGDKSVWGLGFGVEVWRAVCRYLFDELKLRKLTAGTAANNLGMLGIMRKAGMREEARRARQLLMAGSEVDMIYAAVFREDFSPD
jgi:[ribosomal protein S5]-alanine N-acetyltransferase